MGRIGDERNLYAAMRHLAAYGGEAPGPNDLSIDDFTDPELWDISRELRDAIRTHRYRPGEDRTVEIPKVSGVGTRGITLQNIEDRTVQRATLQMLQPLIDPKFDPCSFGFRPKRDRRHALATATFLAETKNRWIWIAADIRTAFDKVPRRRLLDVVRKQLPNSALVDFIDMLVDKGTKKGIRQGGSLSPFLLNVYLDHFLDQPWRRLHPLVPLIRYADDVLLLCRTKKGASEMYEDLQRMLREAGLPLKEPEGDPIIDLRGGGTVSWLGYAVTHQAGKIRVRLDETFWADLDQKLESIRDKPAAPLRANDVMRSLISQAGPARPPTRPLQEQFLKRVQEAAWKNGFDEGPTINALTRMLNAGHARYVLINRAIQKAENPASAADASGPVRSPPGVHAEQNVTIYTDGCCIYPDRVGGCAWIARDEQTGHMTQNSGRARKTTNNRMELIAVIRALSALASPSRVHLRTDSLYVARGMSEWLDCWKVNDWHTVGGKRRPIKNRKLWQTLDRLLDQHLVSVEWVRGHAGNQWNEECDRLANRAARSLVVPCT